MVASLAVKGYLSFQSKSLEQYMADDRRKFLKQGMTAIASLMAMPLASASEPNQKVALTKPVRVNVLENKEDVDGDRTETTSKFELVGSNGSVHRITGYNLKIERDDSYDVTSVLKTDRFLTANDTEPADSDIRIIITSGDKGSVEGDHRHDEIQTTIIGPNGIVKSPLISVKKSLVDPYEGLSVQDMAQSIVDSRFKNPGRR
jgi:hypothetical protein